MVLIDAMDRALELCHDPLYPQIWERAWDETLAILKESCAGKEPQSAELKQRAHDAREAEAREAEKQAERERHARAVRAREERAAKLEPCTQSGARRTSSKKTVVPRDEVAASKREAEKARRSHTARAARSASAHGPHRCQELALERLRELTLQKKEKEALEAAEAEARAEKLRIGDAILRGD